MYIIIGKSIWSKHVSHKQILKNLKEKSRNWKKKVGLSKTFVKECH